MGPILGTTLLVFEISCFLCWCRYCKDPNAPWDLNITAAPQCSVLWNGSFIDNIRIRRKGATSQSWPKPKFKLDASNLGHVFEYAPGLGKQKKIDMNSGERERLTLVVYLYPSPSMQ